MKIGDVVYHKLSKEQILLINYTKSNCNFNQKEWEGRYLDDNGRLKTRWFYGCELKKRKSDC